MGVTKWPFVNAFKIIGKLIDLVTASDDGKFLYYDHTTGTMKWGTVAEISDAAYGVGWDNVTTIAPSKNAVYDKVAAMDGQITALGSPVQVAWNYDCSTNPNYPAATKAGQAIHVSTAGKIGGASGKDVEQDDLIVALNVNAGGTEAAVGTDWFVMQGNIVNAVLKATNDLTGTALKTYLETLFLTDIVEDTTPELGGEMDCGEHTIGFTLKDNGNGGAAKTIDWRLSNFQKITLTADCELTFTAPSNPCGLSLLITQDGTGGWDVTLPASCKVLGTAPTFTDGGISKSMILSLRYDGTYYWYQGSAWEA